MIRALIIISLLAQALICAFVIATAGSALSDKDDYVYDQVYAASVGSALIAAVMIAYRFQERRLAWFAPASVAAILPIIIVVKIATS